MSRIQAAANANRCKRVNGAAQKGSKEAPGEGSESDWRQQPQGQLAKGADQELAGFCRTCCSTRTECWPVSIKLADAV